MEDGYGEIIAAFSIPKRARLLGFPKNLALILS